MNNYFVKNTVDLPDEYNYKVVTSWAAFDEMFGTAATMNNNVVEPDFSGQRVVALIARPSQPQQEIGFNGAAIGGKIMNVYYRVKKVSTQSFTSTPMALATVPKAMDVRTVNFYQDSVLVKTIPVNMY